jgi:hypothetical protein
MQIAKIYQDGKYIDSVPCGSFEVRVQGTILYEGLEYQNERAIVPISMMIIFHDGKENDYDKVEKDLKERK